MQRKNHLLSFLELQSARGSREESAWRVYKKNGVGLASQADVFMERSVWPNPTKAICFIKFFRLTLKKKNNKTQDKRDFYLSSFFSSLKYLHGCHQNTQIL